MNVFTDPYHVNNVMYRKQMHCNTTPWKMSLNTVHIRTGTNVLLIVLVTACLTLMWYKSRCLPVDLSSMDVPGPASRAEIVSSSPSGAPMDYHVDSPVEGNATPYIHQCDSIQENSSITFRLICPPGYTRRLPEILILGDSFTGKKTSWNTNHSTGRCDMSIYIHIIVS